MGIGEMIIEQDFIINDGINEMIISETFIIK